MIAETVNTNKETVRKILYDELNMKKVCEVGPKNFDYLPETRPSTTCPDFLEKLDEEPELVENIIACD